MHQFSHIRIVISSGPWDKPPPLAGKHMALYLYTWLHVLFLKLQLQWYYFV
ncbi:hypothetical protein LEMLEM_LOCUS9926 [Lemmus lemmus]